MAFEYKIKAHPTKYNGVMFRSRLEARWAAFFDLIGWEWEYEPLDLNGWVPDFRLTLPPTETHPEEYFGVKFVRDRRPFVEVKPCEDAESFPMFKIAKAVEGSENTEVLLLGVDPFHTWRIPDCSWADPMELHLGGIDAWREAGNITQWRKK